MTGSVTMKTVAQKAGVTQATVSLSLANNPRIPVETRERIRAIAQELGYRPNPYVAALMRSRRQNRSPLARPVLALVNGLETRSSWRTTAAPTVRDMRLGAIARAQERGYKPEEFWLFEDNMSAARFGGMLRARGIAGVLLGPLSPGAQPPELPWGEFAAVRLGVPLPEFNLPTVCNDHFFSSQQVVRHTHELGYRRPGLVMLSLHRRRFHGRWEGGLESARHLFPGMKPTAPLLLESFDELSSLGGWLKREKPDVIVSPQPESLQAPLAKLGYRIPRDLGLASLACRAADDAISGVWQNGALLGATAIDRIISMLESNERGFTPQASVTMVEGVWNPGTTLRAAAR